MRVLITGGAGHVGRAMTRRFVEHGWDVHVIGLDQQANLPGATYAYCDIMDYDSLREQMRGCHAVVHLAAYAAPSITTGTRTFNVNVSGTFNVFEAADAEGIKRIVQASSINAFGCFWGVVDIAPHYLPIDEAHPTNTTDPYSYSKELVENIGDYYWRRSGISSVALRFPYVYPSADLHGVEFLNHRQQTVANLEALLQLPEDERRERINAIHAQTMKFRRERRLEGPHSLEDIPAGYPKDDWLWNVCLSDRFVFWAYVDDRDTAQAAEKGLTANFEGSHALFINATNNSLNYDSQTLQRVFYPELAPQNLTGAQAFVSIEKARALIGFEPEYDVY